MTHAEALTKALVAFDQIVADRERSNITAMLADDVEPDQIDAFLEVARDVSQQSRADYAESVASLLNGQHRNQRSTMSARRQCAVNESESVRGDFGGCGSCDDQGKHLKKTSQTAACWCERSC